MIFVHGDYYMPWLIKDMFLFLLSQDEAILLILVSFSLIFEFWKDDHTCS